MTDTAAISTERVRTTDDAMDAGRRARRRTPRSALADLAVGERDPLGILAEQHLHRIPELVPLRIERMSADPFAFFRGAAALQAADLARGPSTDILVASCGDAHVANFGYFASPQRTLVFDVNDFDEAAWAPWEWDVKRLVTSIIVAGRATHRDSQVVRQSALASVWAYARSINTYARRAAVDRYFEHFEARASMGSMRKSSRDAVTTAIRAAEKRTGRRSARTLTTIGQDGRIRFIDRPPTMVHGSGDEMSRLNDNMLRYRLTANVDVRMVLAQYDVTDIVMRVVGVGSVGTVCALVALQDGDGRALILQGKQAQRSALEEYGSVPQPDALVDHVERYGQGGRVVALQRILQALSDPFLGHLRAEAGDFYVRQFHDMKGSLDVALLDDRAFRRYGEACAEVLARAHAQSPTVREVAGYLGRGRKAASAIVKWSDRYARLSLGDYRAFVTANASAAANAEKPAG